MRHAKHVEERNFVAEVSAHLEREGRPRRGPRAKKLWYARYRFWREAEKLCEGQAEPLEHISELDGEQRKQCLLAVHTYFRQQTCLQARGRGAGFVKLGLGPGLDADVTDSKFDYNGSNSEGGRVFKWYSLAVFQDRLREVGWTTRGCKTGAEVHSSASERQCMRALELTDKYFRDFLAASASLCEFAGPQCYPQVAENARYRANELKDAPLGHAHVPLLPAAREQMQCWLRCGKCLRLRLIGRRSSPSVDTGRFADVSRDHADSRNWGV